MILPIFRSVTGLFRTKLLGLERLYLFGIKDITKKAPPYEPEQCSLDYSGPGLKAK